jgi:hypothetical protein
MPSAAVQPQSVGRVGVLDLHERGPEHEHEPSECGNGHLVLAVRSVHDRAVEVAGPEVGVHLERLGSRQVVDGDGVGAAPGCDVDALGGVCVHPPAGNVFAVGRELERLAGA